MEDTDHARALEKPESLELRTENLRKEQPLCSRGKSTRADAVSIRLNSLTTRNFAMLNGSILPLDSINLIDQRLEFWLHFNRINQDAQRRIDA